MENNQTNNNSTIVKIKEPDFSKEVVITELRASKEMIDWHFNKMKEALGEKATDKDIWEKINSLVLRDNVFNQAMKILVPCYDIKISPENLKQVNEFLRKTNKSLANVDDNMVNMMAQRMIEKQMVFAVVSKEWNITVSDDEAKKMLEAYYRVTNQPIREIMANDEAMKNVKNTMLEQKIADAICKKLKWKADWEAIQKAAQINNAQVLKEQEDKKKEEEAKAQGNNTIIEK